MLGKISRILLNKQPQFYANLRAHPSAVVCLLCKYYVNQQGYFSETSYSICIVVFCCVVFSMLFPHFEGFFPFRYQAGSNRFVCHENMVTFLPRKPLLIVPTQTLTVWTLGIRLRIALLICPGDSAISVGMTKRFNLPPFDDAHKYRDSLPRLVADWKDGQRNSNKTLPEAKHNF